MEFGERSLAAALNGRVLPRDEIVQRVATASHRMLIGSDWVTAVSGETSDVIDPGLGVVIATVPCADKRDVDKAVAAARSSFSRGNWTRLATRERGRILNRVADLVQSNATEFASIEVLNNGMPRAFALGMVKFAASTFRYFAGWCDKVGGSVVNLSEGETEFHAQITREPVGVVGLIIPWNGPLGSASLKLATALAAGCSCVLKPSEETPLTALLLGKILLEAGVPAGVVNIVTGFGHTAGAAIASHPDVDKVSFTGSTEVGKLIVAASAGNLKKLSLELGGKSPVLVLNDADMRRAPMEVAMGTFINSGQVCVAGSRVYVQRGIAKEFVAAMAEFTKGLKLGTGFDSDAMIGPLISQKQLGRVTDLVSSALVAPTQRIVGRGAPGNAGYFYEPTILTDIEPGSRILREEIFGPVITVIPFDDLDGTIEIANDSEYGLAAAVWTQSVGEAHRISKRLRAGTVWVNCQMVLAPEMPFGGFKQSGWGRENGFEGLGEYLQTKSTIIKL